MVYGTYGSDGILAHNHGNSQHHDRWTSCFESIWGDLNGIDKDLLNTKMCALL